MTKEQAEKIVKLLADIDIDIRADELLDIESYDDLTDYLQDNDYFNVEIIYHARAMEYLMEHDTSLQYSLGLAHDTGYSCDKLSSEILASILASENVREDYYDLHDDINEVLDSEEE